MAKESYRVPESQPLILRDHLALDRTILANERTLLAYVRTGLTLVIVSVTFIKFLDFAAFDVLGWILMPVAALICVLGFVRYQRLRQLVGTVRRNTQDASAAGSGSGND